MPLPDNTAYAKEIRDFEKQGFLVIPEALTMEQIAALNRAIERDRQAYPEGWLQFNEALAQAPDILARTSDFDFAIENPLTLGFLRNLIGEDITFEEFLAMIREPTTRPQ